ncbi:PD-(D/E)XK nuclease family protein, partial [bacterium]|nr:PD-(D/E)XK nuclease family protein [bacterium]
MITITTGMIKTFEESHEKYDFIYNKHLEIPSNDTYSEIGKKIHALINYSLKNFNIENIINTLDTPENKEVKFLWENYEALNIKNCIESEFTFTIPFNKKIKLSGRVDAIRKIDDCYEILDWKTGKSSNIN